MVRQKPWDKYEAAILLDAVIKVRSGEIDRKQAIADVSEKLRKRAQMAGIQIDNVYRDVAGITFQMYSMESAYEGHTLVKPPTKLFLDIVKMMKENKEEYNAILHEAMNVAGTDKTTEENFLKWLSKRFSPVLQPELYIAYVHAYIKINEFFLKSHILEKPLFATKDKRILDLIQKNIETNQFFRSKYEKQIISMSEAIQYYIQYVNGEKSPRNLSEKGGIESILKVSSNIETQAVKKMIGEETRAILYRRLKSMADVYDNEDGFETEWIRSKLGLQIETSELEEFMNGIPWITRIKEGVYSFSKKAEQRKNIDKEALTKVLMLRYQNGMQFDSIDIENFRETYSDVMGETIDFSDDELESYLRKCGVMYRGRVFPAEGIINNNAKEKLLEYIARNFDDGKSVLYYKAIFSDLSEVFANCYTLTDPMMLKAYLEYIYAPDEFFFADEYMTRDKNIKKDRTAEIEDYILSTGKPLSYEEIYTGLSHISKDIIYKVIKSSSNIILNGKEHYFHYGIFEFSPEDADEISSYISNDIEQDGYCIWSQVFTIIKKTMPMFIENNAYLSSLGVRNAVAKKMSGRFYFDGEVICSCGETLSMSDIYRLYGEHHTPFSDDDIYRFSKELGEGGSAIYFDSLSESSARVSKKLFVSRKNVKFDIEATDNAISTYLSKGYMLIKDIDSFLVFPNVGYEWNEFLLETYLMYYSDKYFLANNGRSLNNVAGAVVRKGSGFDNFIDVCADALARSGCELTKNKALNYLGEVNLLTRRRYSKIDDVIIKAKQIRNRKE